MEFMLMKVLCLNEKVDFCFIYLKELLYFLDSIMSLVVWIGFIGDNSPPETADVNLYLLTF